MISTSGMLRGIGEGVLPAEDLLISDVLVSHQGKGGGHRVVKETWWRPELVSLQPLLGSAQWMEISVEDLFTADITDTVSVMSRGMNPRG